jgi:hypothetical protein
MKTQLRRLKPGKLIFIGLLSLVLGSASVSLAQIVVTTLADSGTGSLRAAITTANGDGVATTIIFDPAVFPPPPALPGVILLATPLPNLTGIRGDTIDGTGAGVVLDGSALAAGSVGLTVRRSNNTIRGLTIQNMPNDGIRVETPPPPTTVLNVTGVVIDGNTLLRNGTRGIHVIGGIGPGKTVSATVTNNTLEENVRGMQVLGNTNTPGDPGGNTVTALLDSNTLIRSVTEGILIGGGNVAGSNNSVTATFSNNLVKENGDEGIVAVGCTTSSTGSNNSVNVAIINNNVRDHPTSGIVVTGGSPSSSCVGNSMQFEISGNNVVGNRTQNIVVTGGSGTGHDVQGIVTENSAKNSPAGDGISVSGGSGTGNQVHDITVSANQVSGNFSRGILISGGSNSVNAVLDGIDVLSNHVRTNGDQGILITGGILSENATISDVLIDGNISDSNGTRGIIVTRGQNLSAFPPLISLAGITNNMANDNNDDGIFISDNIPGSGNTPISGNRADGNGVDGIQISSTNSTGYVLSNNTASRNAGRGITAPGNTNGGGNKATRNASCNTPGCF